jgi:hypothetical protein
MKKQTLTEFTAAASPDNTLHDARQPATYRSTGLSRYDGNPLIEALPPILSEADAAKSLTYLPPYKAGEHQLPDHLRLHCIHSALELFIPLPIHMELEQRFSAMIRNGYVGRNPATPQFWGDLDGRVRDLQSGSRQPVRVPAPGFTIIGISGGGKTTGIDRTLGLYPQVVRHTQYKGQRLNAAQVVHLKMTCPFDGSVKGLCLHFFEAMDKLLGTNEYERYVGTRVSVDQLLPSMARLAAIHNLGVLVIDEIQHLSQSKSGGRERMLNFFVDLVDRIHLPVVLVGTYAAAGVLGDEFRQIRRGCGQGDLVWDPLLNDGTWKLFVEGIWRYQYLRHETLLTDELLVVLYDECQGIIDFAVKIFMLAQARAIKSGREAITPAIIRSVSHDSLRTAQPVLRALRLKDFAALAHMKDVSPINFNLAMEHICKTTRREVPSTTSSKGGPGKVEDCRATEVAATKPAIAKRHTKTIIKAADSGMLATTTAGLDAAVGPYTALKIGNFLRPASEFLTEGAA